MCYCCPTFDSNRYKFKRTKRYEIMVEILSKNIIPVNDAERLEALVKYEILYTSAEEAFDNITKMIAQVFAAPMAFISLVDKDDVFYKSQVGPFGKDQVARADSLCSLTILNTEPLVIEDASGEACFKDNPYVSVEGGIKFYAGAPLITKEGYNIGTACIVDTKQRKFSEEQKQLLVRFSKLVMHEIELRLITKTIMNNATEEMVARKRAEEVQKTLSSVLEALPEKGWTANELGEANYLTKGWYEYTGQAYGEAEGNGWTAAIHPDDMDELVKKWFETVRTGRVLHHEARIRNKEGEFRWHILRSVPINDSVGKITQWGGTCTDVHERNMKKEELETKVLERTIELERSNKSLGEFAYAASHDLKEPIRKIRYFLERIKDRLKEKLEEQDLQFFGRIDNAAQRMSTLIDDLLTYSSVSRGVSFSQEVDMNDMIGIVLEDLELEIQEKSGKITVAPLPTIQGHKRQLQQLFQNLITNALKYSKHDVPPVVHISFQQITDKDIPPGFTERAVTKEYHIIEVKDNGIGFEQTDAERIFQMFQRLHGKAEYEGTGIGLSIARKVAENHKGYIWAESEPGEGSTFKILFPVE